MQASEGIKTWKQCGYFYCFKKFTLGNEKERISNPI